MSASTCNKCGNDRWMYSDLTLTDGQPWCFWCIKCASVKMYKESPVCPYCSGININHKEGCQLMKLLEYTNGIKEVYEGYEYK